MPGNAPAPLASPDPRVALFWAPRTADAAAARAAAGCLASGERARAARFGTDALRHRYVVGRATLRRVLAARLGMSPGAVPIVRGRRGRPVLADGQQLDFNVTHTAEVMLIAIASGTIVGVDVERTQRRINVEGIARRCLTAAERARLAMLDPDAARRAVLRLWTCKEAMSKATGDGLAAPFRDLDVMLEPALSLHDGPPPYVPGHWRLHAIGVPTGYLATLALWRAGAGDTA
jgi:4'-phosphopantetheinyl transferase